MVVEALLVAGFLLLVKEGLRKREREGVSQPNGGDRKRKGKKEPSQRAIPPFPCQRFSVILWGLIPHFFFLSPSGMYHKKKNNKII